VLRTRDQSFVYPANLKMNVTEIISDKSAIVGYVMVVAEGVLIGHVKKNSETTNLMNLDCVSV